MGYSRPRALSKLGKCFFPRRGCLCSCMLPIMCTVQRIAILVLANSGIGSFCEGTVCHAQVFDLQEPETLAHLPRWLSEFETQAGIGKVIVVVGNKNDKPNAKASIDDAKAHLETLATEEPTRRDILYFEASAKTGIVARQLVAILQLVVQPRRFNPTLPKTAVCKHGATCVHKTTHHALPTSDTTVPSHHVPQFMER